MANWENIIFDTDALEAGKFYAVYVNKDNATLTILKDVQDAVNAQVELNRFNIQSLYNVNSEYLTLIEDNKARINNLEDRDLVKEFFIGLDHSIMKVMFTNQTEIRVDYGRKEITSITIYRVVNITPTEYVYEEVTSGVNTRYHTKFDETGKVIERYVLITTEQPITGYALLL